MSVLASVTETLVAALPPMDTVVARAVVSKLFPTIVTVTPPLSGPLDGEMEETVGADMIGEVCGIKWYYVKC